MLVLKSENHEHWLQNRVLLISCVVGESNPADTHHTCGHDEDENVILNVFNITEIRVFSTVHQTAQTSYLESILYQQILYPSKYRHCFQKVLRPFHFFHIVICTYVSICIYIFFFLISLHSINHNYDTKIEFCHVP